MCSSVRWNLVHNMAVKVFQVGLAIMTTELPSGNSALFPYYAMKKQP